MRHFPLKEGCRYRGSHSFQFNLFRTICGCMTQPMNACIYVFLYVRLLAANWYRRAVVRKSLGKRATEKIWIMAKRLHLGRWLTSTWVNYHVAHTQTHWPKVKRSTVNSKQSQVFCQFPIVISSKSRSSCKILLDIVAADGPGEYGG